MEMIMLVIFGYCVLHLINFMVMVLGAKVTTWVVGLVLVAIFIGILVAEGETTSANG